MNKNNQNNVEMSKENIKNKVENSVNQEAIKKILRGMHAASLNSIANFPNSRNNKSLNSSLTEIGSKYQTLSHRNKSTVEKYNDNIGNLTTLNDARQKLLEQQSAVLKVLILEDNETKGLINMYKEALELEIKEEQRINEEIKKNEFKVLLHINANKAECDENMRTIQELKATCMNLDSQLSKESVNLFLTIRRL